MTCLKKCIYKVFGNSRDNIHMQIELTKLSRKVLYHFVIFAIINEKLITKNRLMSAICPLKRAARCEILNSNRDC